MVRFHGSHQDIAKGEKKKKPGRQGCISSCWAHTEEEMASLKLHKVLSRSQATLFLHRDSEAKKQTSLGVENCNSILSGPSACRSWKFMQLANHGAPGFKQHISLLTQKPHSGFPSALGTFLNRNPFILWWIPVRPACSMQTILAVQSNAIKKPMIHYLPITTV